MEVDELKEEDYYAVLKFKEEGIQLEKTDRSGEKSIKYISPDDLRNIFVDNTVFDFGFLPLIGKDYIGLRRYIKEGSREIFFIESSPCKTNVLHEDLSNPVENVPWPRLLMVFITDRGASGKLSIATTKLYVLKTPCLVGETKLYRFPFANVYEGDNKICWGDLTERLRNVETSAQMGGMVNDFIHSTMNNDLYSIEEGENDNNHEGDQGKLTNFLKDCAEEGEFPYSLLKDLNMNFNSLIDLCKNYN